MACTALLGLPQGEPPPGGLEMYLPELATKRRADSWSYRSLGLAACGLFLFAVAGCTKINEDYLFTSASQENGGAGNYFRVRVKGSAEWSSARYVAGFYDERAVDLFFNELKTGDSDSGLRPLFPKDLKSPGSGQAIKSLDPDVNGAFIMILSTNADVVADAIGSFGESNVVAEAVTNLANRSEIQTARRSEARFGAQQNRARAIVGELEGLIDQVPANGGKSASEATYRRILSAVSQALGGTGDFANLGQAKAWFDAYRVNVRGP